MFGETTISQSKGFEIIQLISNHYESGCFGYYAAYLLVTLHIPFSFSPGETPPVSPSPAGETFLTCPLASGILTKPLPSKVRRWSSDGLKVWMVGPLTNTPSGEEKGWNIYVLPPKNNHRESMGLILIELKLNWLIFIHGRQPPYMDAMELFGLEYPWGLAAKFRGNHPSRVNQTLMAFQYIDWCIGILILAYYNPHISG